MLQGEVKMKVIYKITLVFTLFTSSLMGQSALAVSLVCNNQEVIPTFKFLELVTIKSQWLARMQSQVNVPEQLISELVKLARDYKLSQRQALDNLTFANIAGEFIAKLRMLEMEASSDFFSRLGPAKVELSVDEWAEGDTKEKATELLLLLFYDRALLAERPLSFDQQMSSYIRLRRLLRQDFNDSPELLARYVEHWEQKLSELTNGLIN